MKASTYHWKTLDGTCYHKDTPAEVIKVLESARKSDTRIRVFYGDTVSGRCWMEENDTIGTIGRSSGDVKVPLLIKTRRSCGGGTLLDHCIVKITAGGKTLYQHGKFNMPGMEVVDSHVHGYTAGVDFDHSRQANFKTKAQAVRYVAFMKGERNSK